MIGNRQETWILDKQERERVSCTFSGFGSGSWSKSGNLEQGGLERTDHCSLETGTLCMM